MSQFGQPTRTATSDANANFVSPPAVKSAGRTATSTSIRVASDTEQAAESLGSSLGKAFHSVLKEKATNINAKRAMQGATDQGNKLAMDDVTKDKGRSGWAEAIWGQDPEYRAAQQQAVTNNITQMQLEQSARMSEFAAEDRETYSTRLQKQLEDQLSKFPNDPETQQLITQHWTKAGGLLSRQQAKEHYGHSLTQARETSKREVAGVMDVFNQQSQGVTNQEGAEEIQGKVADFFSMKGIKQGQSPQAYRSVISEVIQDNLDAGNIGAYNMAKANGWFDSYNAEEQQVLAKSIKKYDTASKQRINLTVAQTSAAMLDANTTEEVEVLLNESAQIFEDHAGRTSGSDAYKLSLVTAENKIKKMAQPALDAALTKEVAAERKEDVMSAVILASEGDSSEEFNLGPVTKAERTAAWVEVERQVVANHTGEEDLSSGDVLKKVLGDPAIAAQLIPSWKRAEGSSGMLKGMGEAYISGFDSPRMVDEDHQPTEMAQNIMSTLGQYEAANRGKMIDEMGPDNFLQYNVIKNGQQAGKTSDMIQRELTLLSEAQGNMDAYAPRWSDVIQGDDTPRDYVSSMYYKATDGESLTGENIGNMMQIYKTGLLLGKGDHKTAERYFKDIVGNKKTTVLGNVIHNADGTGLKDYPLNVYLKEAGPLLTGYVTAMLGNTENEAGQIINSLHDPELAGTLRITVPPQGGIIIDSNRAAHSVHVPAWKMQEHEAALQQKALDDQLVEESRLRSQKEQNKMDDILGFSRVH